MLAAFKRQCQKPASGVAIALSSIAINLALSSFAVADKTPNVSDVDKSLPPATTTWTPDPQQGAVDSGCFKATDHTSCAAGHYKRVTVASENNPSVDCYIYSQAATRKLLVDFIEKLRTKTMAELQTKMMKTSFNKYLDAQKLSVDPLKAPKNSSVPSTTAAKDQKEAGISAADSPPGADATGSAEIIAIESKISLTYVRIQKMDAAIAKLNLEPTPGPQDIYSFPDSRYDFFPGKHLKDPNSATGEIIAGTTNTEKLRNFASGQFERMVRIFIGGTPQLALDTGAPYKANGIPIGGFYQGYEPDMLYAKDSPAGGPGEIIYLNKNPELAPCGVANPLNDANMDFKFPDGQYHAETLDGPAGMVTSHTPSCQSGGHYRRQGNLTPLIQGEVVAMAMILMRTVSADLKKGQIVHASAYKTVLDDCTIEYESWMKPARDQLFSAVQATTAGIKAAAGTNGPVVLECEDQLNAQDASSSGNNQMRSCHIASIMNDLENEAVVRYAYCTWHTVWDAVRKLIFRPGLTSINPVVPTLKNDPPTKAVASSGMLFSLSIGGIGGMSRKRHSRKRKNRGKTAAAFAIVPILAVLTAVWISDAAKAHGHTTATCGGGFTSDDSDEETFNFFTDTLDSGQTKIVTTTIKFVDEDIAIHTPVGVISSCPHSSPCNSTTIPICDSKCSQMNTAKANYDQMATDIKNDPTSSPAAIKSADDALKNNKLAYDAQLAACKAITFDVAQDTDASTDDGDTDPDGTSTPARHSCWENAASCDTSLLKMPKAGHLDTHAKVDEKFKIQQQFDSTSAPVSNPGGAVAQDNSVTGPSGSANPNFAAGPQTANATAGDANSSGPKSAKGGGPGPGAGPGGGARNRPGGGASGAGSGGSGFGMSGLTTAPSSPETGAATAGTGDSGLGTGYSAGGGAATSGSGGMGRSDYGSGGSEGGSGSSQNDFGQTVGEGKTSGTEDPADYFTRTNLNENIFKTVEKRYREKATDWAKPESKSSSPKSLAHPKP